MKWCELAKLQIASLNVANDVAFNLSGLQTGAQVRLRVKLKVSTVGGKGGQDRNERTSWVFGKRRMIRKRGNVWDFWRIMIYIYIYIFLTLFHIYIYICIYIYIFKKIHLFVYIYICDYVFTRKNHVWHFTKAVFRIESHFASRNWWMTSAYSDMFSNQPSLANPLGAEATFEQSN